jgi:hypothetical protein
LCNKVSSALAHLGGNVERFMGVVWSSRISSGCGDLRIVKELHRQFFLRLHLRGGCGLLDPFGDFPSATNNVRLTQGEGTAAAHRRHSLEVEDGGLLKDLVVIFIFLRVLCTVQCSSNARVLFAKKKQGWDAAEILGGGWGPADGLGDLDSRNSRRQMGTGGWRPRHLRFISTFTFSALFLSLFTSSLPFSAYRTSSIYAGESDTP